MESVAQYLQHEACVRRPAEQRDDFGRSSFNRYYYAAYLRVRRGLGSLRREWAGMAHASIPKVLRGAVTQELRLGRRKAQRAEDPDVQQLCNRAIAAAAGLAKLMDEGRMTRIVADYEPDIAVDFAGGTDFSLNTVPIAQARSWPTQAEVFANSIELAWRQIGV